MFVIYSLKLPFFERYKVDNVILFLFIFFRIHGLGKKINKNGILLKKELLLIGF